MATLIPVLTDEELLITEKLADIVWRAHYIPIVGKAQIDYMLEKFQSFAAMKQQIAEGYRYYLIYENNEAAGYFAIQERGRSLFLSKLYVLEDWRNRGLAKLALDFIEKEANTAGLEQIDLTVNKENTGSIAAYERMGFKNAGPIIADIGRGYVMDDYKMVKTL